MRISTGFVPRLLTVVFFVALLGRIPTAFSAWPVPTPDYLAGFPVALSGDFARSSSIAIGDVDGDEVPDFVFGGSDGMLYAYKGTGVLIWEIDTGDMAIEGKVAIADIDGDTHAEVVIGAGSTFTPNAHGALYVIDHLGAEQCHFDTLEITGDSWREGVYSSPALADLDGDDGGRLEIVFGAWDHHVRAIHDDCTVLWDVDAYDTVWSSPAIGDLDGDGSLEVVVGADSHHEPLPIGTEDGGRLLVMDGGSGTYRAGFPIQIDEVIVSAPALADLDGDGFLEIVAGTGNCWGVSGGCGSTVYPGAGEYINVWDKDGNPVSGWPVATPDRVAVGSPAVADLDEDGMLEIIINTTQRDTSPPVGRVYALNGDGTSVAGWPVQPSTPADCVGGTVAYATPASPVVADLTGDGHLEVILPSNAELVIWSRDGTQVTREDLVPPLCEPSNPAALYVGTNWAVNSSAGVGDVDGDGDLDLLVAGYAEFGLDPGAVYAWDLAAPSGNEQPWPVFRRDAVNRGTVSAGSFFRDGFEGGNFDGWSSHAP